jgi:HEAT repeat protein
MRKTKMAGNQKRQTARRDRPRATKQSEASYRKRAFQDALEALAHSDEDVRLSAVGMLSAQHPRRALHPLTRALQDSSWKVRLRATECIAPLLAGRTVPTAFMRLLSDRHELVRVQAVEALATIGQSASIRSLISRLRDRSPLVRSYAAASIGVLGSQRHTKALHQRLRVEKNETARLGLFAALYALSDNSALDGLIALLNSRNFEVRGGAASTLARSIADKNNAEDIKNLIKKTLATERSTNLRYHLRTLLQELDSKFPPPE